MTLIAGQDWHYRRASENHANLVGELKRYLRENKRIPGKEEEYHNDDPVENLMINYYKAIIFALHNRCFFVTETGYIGLGPSNLTPGDTLVVVRGAKHPFVLRKCQDGFNLLGSSYIQGIMDGELAASKLAAGEEVEHFDVW